MLDQGLDWGKCVWQCIDRALSMASRHSGATTKVKKVTNKNDDDDDDDILFTLSNII